MLLTHATRTNSARTTANCLILGIFSGADISEQLSAAGYRYKNHATIVSQSQTQQFKGESGKTMTTFSTLDVGPNFVILVGLGERKACKRTSLNSALVAALKVARALKCESVALAPLSLKGTPLRVADYGRVVAEAAMLSQYEYHLKTERGGHKEEPRIKTLEVLHTQPEVAASLNEGNIIAEAIAFARRLSDMPASHMHPEAFRNQTVEVQARSGGKMTIEILTKQKLEEIGANGILAVGSGSAHPCYLIELAYTPPSGATDKVLGLIGKTVLFDSGGVCIKGPAGMADMKRDMEGGANVLAAIQAISQLGIPLSVKAYFAPVFNMLGDDAAKVGDVMHMLGGLTVENVNIDAEGRLCIGEMIEWAQQRGCDWLVDVATLTGAAITVVGDSAACLMGNNSKFTDLVYAHGLATDEDMQVLTMFEQISGYNKSNVADLQNTPGSKGAGCIAAGWFIRKFVRDERQWAHLDIAPVMKRGFGVKTLISLARALSRKTTAKAA